MVIGWRILGKNLSMDDVPMLDEFEERAGKNDRCGRLPLFGLNARNAAAFTYILSRSSVSFDAFIGAAISINVPFGGCAPRRAASSAGRGVRPYVPQRIGAWPSGKAPVFGIGIRRFESCRPSHFQKVSCAT